MDALQDCNVEYSATLCAVVGRDVRVAALYVADIKRVADAYGGEVESIAGFEFDIIRLVNPETHFAYTFNFA